MSAGDTPPPGFIGDAVIRFGGARQEPSTQTMPYTKTRAQLAADKVVATKKTTINCSKGKLVKKVTALKPKCPTGYKKA
jgi:hypothetical protein